MPAPPLDPTQLQAEAQALEAQQAWGKLLQFTEQQRPSHSGDERISAYLDYLAGRALLEQEQAEQALPLLRNAAAVLEQVPYTHNLLGRALAEQQEWLAAVEAQQRCLALKPDFGFAWLELGRAREALGDAEAAQAAYKQALTLLPDNAWLQSRQASLQVRVLLRAGDAASATAAIGELQRLDLVQGARVGDFMGLACMFNELFQGPSRYTSHEKTVIGIALREAGMYEYSRKVFEMTRNGHPYDITSRYELAIQYLLTGNHIQAIPLLEEARVIRAC